MVGKHDDARVSILRLSFGDSYFVSRFTWSDAPMMINDGTLTGTQNVHHFTGFPAPETQVAM